MGIGKYILYFWIGMESIYMIVLYVHYLRKHISAVVIRWMKFLCIVLYICLAGIMGYYLLLYFQVMRLSINQTDVDAKSTVLIMGSHLNDGEMTPQLVNRLDSTLSNDSIVNNDNILVIVSGGYGRDDDQNVTEADRMYDYLIGNGFSKDRIIKENSAKSTVENIVFSKDIWDHTHLIVVSSDFHLPRIKCILDKMRYENYSFISSKTELVLFPYQMLQEACGIMALKVGIY